jgi:hypothetical protein
VEDQRGAGGVCGDADGLGAGGDEVHLDAGLGGVPDGLMGEAVQIEVGVELTVEADEDVAIEGSGDTGGIVGSVSPGWSSEGRRARMERASDGEKLPMLDPM